MTTTPTIWLPEFTVNSSATAGNQNAAKSVTLLDGRVLSVWVDDANNVDASAGTDVIGQIFNATGNPAGTPFQLNEYFTSANEQNADIVALPDGGFAVVYEDRGAANGENAAIRYNVYNKYGIHIDSGTVDTGTIGGTENANPSVIVLAGGSIAVTYERTTLGNTDTVTRIVDLATGTAGALLQAADNNGADTEASAETDILATGNLVTVYERESTGQTSVEFKIMDGAGATVGSVTELSSDGSDVQVATLASGNFVVAWVDGAGGGLRAEVRGNSGAVVTANFQVAAGATAPAGADAVALKDGGFFLTWKDGAAGELVGQRFDAAGALVGDIVTIATGAAVADAKTSLAHDGRILVTFANASSEISQVILDPRDNVINGSEFRDALTSRVEGATVNGLGGNDTIVGLGGDDALYGGSKRDLLSGGAGNDSIFGGYSADTLDGGTGADFMRGGDNNDVFVFKIGEVIGGDFADGGSGVDKVLANSSVDLSVASFSSIEGLEFGEKFTGAKTITIGASQIDNGFSRSLLIEGAANGQDALRIMMGSSTALDISAFQFSGFDGGDFVFIAGDADAETIVGSSASDHVFGRGGNDTMAGGGGNDLLNAGLGNDFVTGGLGRDRLLGAAGNDTLLGGNGNDVLTGGRGIDRLQGGKGNDVYNVDHRGEAIELRNGGTDTVNSSVSYSLGGNIENLNLTGVRDIIAAGNALDNIINGNSGVNFINGRSGNDTLTGNSGADKFVFNSFLSASGNTDTITDFETGIDRIRLENSVFKALAPGKLSADAFVIGTEAHDANDRIIYDDANGALYYDKDGSGSAAQVRFAILDAGLALTHGDIIVF